MRHLLPAVAVVVEVGGGVNPHIAGLSLRCGILLLRGLWLLRIRIVHRVRHILFFLSLGSRRTGNEGKGQQQICGQSFHSLLYIDAISHGTLPSV